MKVEIIHDKSAAIVTVKDKDIFRSISEEQFNVASGLLDRVCASAFDSANIKDAMLSIWGDLGSGQAWVRSYTTDGDRICIDHLDRRDIVRDI